jgi:hypothetical protein
MASNMRMRWLPAGGIWGWGRSFASTTLLCKVRRPPLWGRVARVPGRFSPSSPDRAFRFPETPSGTGTLVSSPAVLCPGAVYTCFMRAFSLLFAAIALVILTIFVIYVVRGPADPVIAGGIFVSFLACLAPALLLLKPFEPPEALQRRREEARRRREERQRSKDDSGRGSGS